MGDFYCSKCDIHREYSTLREALERFDHGVAITKGRQCPNDQSDFTWNGIPVLAVLNDIPRAAKSASPEMSSTNNDTSYHVEEKIKTSKSGKKQK